MEREIIVRAVYVSENVVSINYYTIEDIICGYGLEWEFSDGTSLPFKDVYNGDLGFELFTGLEDVNKAKIFYGDKLKFTVFDCFDNDTQHEGIVRYDAENAEYVICTSEDTYVLGWVHQQDCELEIVGNIHDQPKSEEA